MLDRRDTAQTIRQALQQRQTVVAHRTVIDIQHQNASAVSNASQGLRNAGSDN